jgi:hypothetical protein
MGIGDILTIEQRHQQHWGHGVTKNKVKWKFEQESLATNRGHQPNEHKEITQDETVPSGHGSNIKLDSPSTHSLPSPQVAPSSDSQEDSVNIRSIESTYKALL